MAQGLASAAGGRFPSQRHLLGLLNAQTFLGPKTQGELTLVGLWEDFSSQEVAEENNDAD